MWGEGRDQHEGTLNGPVLILHERGQRAHRHVAQMRCAQGVIDGQAAPVTVAICKRGIVEARGRMYEVRQCGYGGIDSGVLGFLVAKDEQGGLAGPVLKSSRTPRPRVLIFGGAGT